MAFRFRADDGAELKFYARDAFVSRDGFTFLVAGTVAVESLFPFLSHSK